TEELPENRARSCNPYSGDLGVLAVNLGISHRGTRLELERHFPYRLRCKFPKSICTRFCVQLNHLSLRQAVKIVGPELQHKAALRCIRGFVVDTANALDSVP